jgi:hypothetical protein
MSSGSLAYLVSIPHDGFMARCIPDFIEDKEETHPEWVFFERLKAELPDEFVVIPSLEVAARRDQQESEVDFVLLHPRGRLVIEVKGGKLRRKDGRWERWKGGVWIRENKSPFYQSRVNSHAVREYLEDRFGRGDPRAEALFGRAVVFPDAMLEVDSIEAADQMVIDQSNLVGAGSLLAAVHSLFDQAEKQFKEGRQRKDLKTQQYEAKQAQEAGITPRPVVELTLDQIRLPDPLTDAQILQIADALRPDLMMVPNLSATDVERELIRLSASQLRTLDTVQGSKRLRVVGGPGSGKTLLAVEVARRELRERPGSKIGLVCFNRSLGSFLGEVARSEGLLTAVTGSFYVHVDRLLGDVGRADGDVAYYHQRVQQAINSAKALAEDAKFDVLIVDEGQDFRDDGDKLALLDGLLKGGFAKGRWRWFEDLNQILTPASTEKPSAVLTELTSVLDDAGEYVLKGNWRNTAQIAARVSAAMGLDYEPDGLALEGPEVFTAPLMPGKEFAMLEALVQKKLAPEIATRQYSPEDIVVLSMRGAGKASFEGQTTLGGFPLVPYDPVAPRVPGAIRATSIFKFKGMESHVVIVTDLDQVETLRDRRKAYVGMSRARYKLYLIATEAALANLKRA